MQKSFFILFFIFFIINLDGQAIKEKNHFSENGKKFRLLQITDNQEDEYGPKLDEEGNIVWFGEQNHYYWNGAVIKKIPQEFNRYSWDCMGSYISYGKIALREYLGNEKFGIFIFNIKTQKKTRILENFNYRPGPRGHFGSGWPLGPDSNDWYSFWISIHKNVIAFAGYDGSDYEIYSYDFEGDKLIQITDNDYDDYFPILSGNFISYVCRRGTFKIHLWDGKIDQRISNWPEEDRRGKDDLRHQVDHYNFYGRMAFASQEVPSGEHIEGHQIIEWKNNIFTRTAKLPFDSWAPIVSENYIMWGAWGNKGKPNKNQQQIYIWDGTNTDNLSHNETRNQMGHVLNNKFVWAMHDGEDMEIVMAVPCE